MKKSTKRIGLIILIVVLTIIECLLCHGIALEGNYLVDLPLDHPGIKVIYRDVTILEIFMFVCSGERITTRINHQIINQINRYIIHQLNRSFFFLKLYKRLS